MPRGRRKAIANPSEEIQMIDQKIAELQEQIAARPQLPEQTKLQSRR